MRERQREREGGRAETGRKGFFFFSVISDQRAQEFPAPFFFHQKGRNIVIDGEGVCRNLKVGPFFFFYNEDYCHKKILQRGT